MNGRPNLSPRTRKTALLGMLAAAALALSFLENLIPGLPGLPPGAKPGFSNIATMAAAAQLGFAGAFPITLLKAGFAGLTRGATAFFMSTAGGVLSMLVMLPLLHGSATHSARWAREFCAPSCTTSASCWPPGR